MQMWVPSEQVLCSAVLQVHGIQHAFLVSWELEPVPLLACLRDRFSTDSQGQSLKQLLYNIRNWCNVYC
jgi:predicted metallopeptidase